MLYIFFIGNRYPNLHLKRALKPHQVRHLYDGGDEQELKELVDIPAKRARNNETIPEIVNGNHSDLVRAFAHGAMGRRIDPSWWTH